MRRRRSRGRGEPTIALINIVFLMLVFFMVAGTLAQPLDGTVQLVETQALEGSAPPDALIVHAEGILSHAGQPVGSAAVFVAGLPDEARATVRVVPDRAVPAMTLVAIAQELRGAGADAVVIVTERALQ